MSTKLQSVLRSISHSTDLRSVLNNPEQFLQEVSKYYEPSMKDECRLLERAIRQGAGNIITQYLNQKATPNLNEAEQFVTELQKQAGFSQSEAEMIVDDLFYMVTWPSLYSYRSGKTSVQPTPVRTAPSPAPRTAPDNASAPDHNPTPSPMHNLFAKSAPRSAQQSQTPYKYLIVLGIVFILLGIIGLIAAGQYGPIIDSSLVGSLVELTGAGSDGDRIIFFIAKNRVLFLILGAGSLILRYILTQKVTKQ